ncbi:MAG: hypothetical protein C4547_01705 [Phycisphaerales bacterium]|nr:MAG: hypothetical protein C4547_01705 [Phycisphaerales bacterium]
MLSALVTAAVGAADAHAAEHTLEFVSIDGGAATLAGSALTMSVTVGQTDAVALSSERLQLIGGVQAASLSVRACDGDERLRSNCRAKECGHRFRAVLRGATPGRTVTFLLDGSDERQAVTNGRGKAVVSWCPAAPGRHRASVVECGLSDKAHCR